MTPLETGENLFSQGKLDEAETLFLQEAEADPTNAEALNNLGVVSHSRGDTVKALEYFQKALAARKDHPEASLNLAGLYQKAGRWDLAAAVVEGCLRSGRREASLWNALGAIYLRLGRTSEARSAFAKSLEIDPRQEDTRRHFEQLGGYFVSDTIHHFKKFPHQKYPERMELKLFDEDRDGFTPITRHTGITSMGSCFAREIAEYLLSHEFNYLVTETPFKQASAHWDQVFNTSCMRQIFEYSLTEEWHPLVRWWPKGEQVQDPFRRDILYDRETCEEDFDRHRKASRKALLEAEVVILTLGLVEAWRDRRDRMTFYRVPSPSHYDPGVHEFHIQTVEDCLKDLEGIHDLLGRHNPQARLIVTVSPVPLFATFRTDVDVVTANTLSKSTLRVAAEYLTKRHENVHYFPSYEMVTQAIPNPFEEDNRHVTKEAVRKIMEVFESRYVEGKRA